MPVLSPQSALSRPLLFTVLLLTAALSERSAAQVPATPAPQSETGKWIARFDGQWRTDYQRSIVAPYDAGVTELRRQYLAALGTPQAVAARAGKGDDGAVWRAEYQRASEGGVLPEDDAKLPATIKSLRVKYRAQLARLEKEREERTKGLFARCDAMMVQHETELQTHRRKDEIAELEKERAQLREAWLPAQDAASPAGAVGTGRMTAQEILQKLRDLGADIAVKTRDGTVQGIQADTPAVTGKFTFVRVGFPAQRPDQTPLAAADYDILDSLSEVEELALSSSVVTDAVMEKVRSFRALRSVSLDRTRLTPAGYAVLAGLPALSDLHLRDTATDAAGMAAVAQCRKLRRLGLAAMPLVSESMAPLGKLKELESLELSDLDDLGSAAFEHLAECPGLKSVSLSGIVVLSGMVEKLSHCENLESLSLGNTPLKDADVAPLGALEKLHNLDLGNTSVTGAVFASWRPRKAFVSLNLDNAAGVDDAVCAGLQKVFPMLQDLSVKLAPSGFSSAGARALGRMRDLHSLRLGGPGINDELVALLVHAMNLTNLSIPQAQLTDPGAAALSHLPHLTELSLEEPPITEAALKSFGHCKALKVVNIGKDAVDETAYKLKTAVPGLTVHRPEE
jgi:hypothetical protein